MKRTDNETRTQTRRTRNRTETRRNARRSSKSRTQPGALAPAAVRRYFVWVQLLIALVMLVIVARLAYIQLVQHSFYLEKAQQLHTVEVDIHPRRGTIYDRNGQVLAKSVDAKTLYCNPTEIQNPDTTAQELAEILGGTQSTYLERLTKETSFSPLAKQVDPAQAQKVLSKKIAGIYALDDTKRIYPNGAVASQIIGVVDENGDGKTGLELQYNDILKGTNGKVVMERGRGNLPVVNGVQEQRPAQDGTDIVVSIDVALQKRVEEVLAFDAADIGVKDAMSVMMDPRTGEILAACSTPLFNLNDRSVVADDATNLKAVTNAFEPGSTIKTVTASAGIDSGHTYPDKSYFCPSSLSSGDDHVSDYYPRGDIDYTLREILMHSSNVGSVLVEREMGAETFYDYLLKFGFGSKTGVDFPGETAGILHPPADWNAATADNMSFGQGLSVNSIQITNAVATIANSGLKNQPHFLMIKGGQKVNYDAASRIISEKAAHEVGQMMRDTVREGGVKTAQIPGYDVSAKSGTAQIANTNSRGYSDKVAISIVGFAPTDNPKVVLFTIFYGAPGVYTSHTVGTSWTAMMSSALSHLEVPYQNPDEAKKQSASFKDKMARYNSTSSNVGH